MKIYSAISLSEKKVYFSSKPEGNNNSEKEKIENIETEDNQNKKVAGYVVAAALSAAVLAGGLVHGHYSKELKSVRRSSQEMLDSIRRSAPYRENETLKRTNQALNQQVSELTKQNNNLQTIVDEARSKFANLFEGDIAPSQARDNLYQQLKTKLSKADYGYDIKKPPVVRETKPTNAVSRDILPVSAVTTNRIGMRDLNIPEISPDGKFEYELPTTDAIKITHDTTDFTPVKSKESTVSLSYGNSVQWNSDKVARDLLQNFYDGHGQTLDGVKLLFTPIENGRYRVRIEGKSTFTPEKAIYLGMSSKQFDSKAAGNYGEGLKMAALKLLTEAGANDVRIASDNWKCIWTVGQSELKKDVPVLYYSVDKVPSRLDGNYVEFETNSKDLLNSLRKSINRFYHSNNKDFECPNFENEILGIKALPKGEKGAIYIAGQRFEFEGDYRGLEGATIFLKEKPPIRVLDPSRDRTSLNASDIQKLAEWLAYNEKISFEDDMLIIKSLEHYWNHEGHKPLDKFMDKFLFNLGLKSSRSINFPEKFVAYSNASDDVVNDLERKGYVICKMDFHDLGMHNIHEVMKGARAHDVVVPNETEKQKILILREAIKKLAPELQVKHFTSDELDTKIYMFDRTTKRERQLYSDCNAEAIIDAHHSKGFWIDKTYLNEASFSEALETALHELSHKAGGDESSNFSYKLTDVNATAIKELLESPQIRTELQALQRLWEG